MCLEIGNRVAVLDEAISGVVISVKEDVVFFKDADGMEYGYKNTDLVKVDIDQDTLLKNSKTNNYHLKDKVTEVSKRKIFKKFKNEVIMEVDLHADKLVKSTKGMNNFDVLNLQLDTARYKLEYCIQRKISKIIFIHGIGEGILKSELRYLFNKYPVSYQDASYQKYGLGATEVYVFQNINN